MQDLISQYNVTEIIILIIVLGLAIKDFITNLDWFKNRTQKYFDKAYDAEKEKAALEERLKKGDSTMESLQTEQEALHKAIQELTDKVNLLISSDMDDIKSWITREYHYFCEQKQWIDDYSLECLEKRYAHYVDEGGNSFIEALMNELRKLPHQPSQDK